MSNALKWICRVISLDRAVSRRIDAVQPIVAYCAVFPPHGIMHRMGARVSPMAVKSEFLQRRPRPGELDHLVRNEKRRLSGRSFRLRDRDRRSRHGLRGWIISGSLDEFPRA